MRVILLQASARADSVMCCKAYAPGNLVWVYAIVLLKNSMYAIRFQINRFKVVRRAKACELWRRHHRYHRVGGRVRTWSWAVLDVRFIRLLHHSAVGYDLAYPLFYFNIIAYYARALISFSLIAIANVHIIHRTGACNDHDHAPCRFNISLSPSNATLYANQYKMCVRLCVCVWVGGRGKVRSCENFRLILRSNHFGSTRLCICCVWSGTLFIFGAIPDEILVINSE